MPKIAGEKRANSGVQPTRKSVRIRNQPQLLVDSLTTQSPDQLRERERGRGTRKGTSWHKDPIQSGPEVETSSNPNVRKDRSRSSPPARKNKKSTHPATVVSIGCQTDGLNGKDIFRCPQCSLLCWLCNTTKTGDKDPPQGIRDNPMADETSTDASLITTSKTTGKRKRAVGWLGPKGKDFETKILAVVGVRLPGEIQFLKPKDVFPNLTQFDSRIKSRIFLDIDREEAIEISSQFAQVQERRYDENFLTMVVLKELAPVDRVILREGPKVVKSLCRPRWRPGKEGPLVPPHLERTYDWDVEPDLTYMPSINILSQDIRENLFLSGLDHLLADPHGVCPYLTVELKCNEKAGKDSEAKCQVAAASVLWLYQRLQIKLALSSEGLKSADLGDFQHYSIVLNSTNFQIWLSTFDGKYYQVKMIYMGLINNPEGIESYANWWNAIHAWGLGYNAQSFKKDFEVLWKRKMNEPASLIPTLPRSEEGAQAPSFA